MGSSPGPQHQAASVSAEQTLVQSPGVMLYFINPPEQVFVSELCNWFQLPHLLFSCCTGGLFPAMLLLLWNISQAPHPRHSLFSYRPERAISTQNSLQRPLKLLPAQEWGTVSCVLGNILAFKEANPRIPLQFFYRKKQGKSFMFLQINLSPGLTQIIQKPCKEWKHFPILCRFCALYSCSLNICQHIYTTYCSMQAHDLCMASSPLGLP